jgi:hypothetical protein
VIEDCGRGAGQTKTKETFVHIERKIGASVAVLGSLVLVLSTAAPALANSRPSARSAHVTRARFAIANVTSTAFAGWAFGAAGATSVTSEFKVPKLTCTSTPTGVGPSSIMATNNNADGNVAGVLAVCSSGKPLLIPTVTVNNTETNGTQKVTAGDLMKATVVTSATKTTSTLQDLTHKFTLTKSAKSAGAASEELIGNTAVLSGTTQVGVAKFGTITFTNAAVSGKAIGSVKPQVAVNMQTKAKVLQILTGKITGTKKNQFTTTWKHV